MHVSYRWLCRHVDVRDVHPEEIARDLTLRTAEVEGVHPFAPVLDDVVVGHVVERAKHPDADKLSVCRVDVGEGDPLSIVCGAPNVRAELKVAVAKVGTVLPGDVKIKKSKIRGESSSGMICSERELGLGEDHDGIWELPADAPLGVSVTDAFGRVHGAHDWVLEIDNKSLTHRPDCWGHRGLAREIAAIRGLELLPLDVSLPACGGGAPFPVRIESESCFRYLALPIDGVRAVRSPEWLRLLLLAADQRPIDLLVDVSNFVMLDLGQPNHLFDRKRLSREGIVVRDARAGETMTTLDGMERKLLPSDMLICDGDDPVALAGVMGGEGTKVGAGTDELLLEVAAFHPATVRRTAMRLGLRSSASARFEKHLDPTLPLDAAGHLVRTLQAIQPDLRLPSPPTDAGTWESPARAIALRPDRVRALLGVEIERDEVAAMLARLGFAVEPGMNGAMAVGVPSWRATKDVTIEEDLVEEIARMLRYDRIPERPLVGTLRPIPRDVRRATVRRVQDRLAGGARYHEVLTYSFLSDELATRLGIADERYVTVKNPVAEGLTRVRRSVAPSVLGVVENNLHHRDVVQLFEVGKGYLPEHANERGEPREIHEVALVRAAPPPPAGARFDAGSLPHLEGVVEDLVGLPLAWRRAEPGELPPWSHPARAVCAHPSDAPGGAPRAWLGALEPGVARALGLAESDVAVATISLDAWLPLADLRPPYRPIPRFPGVKVDVALALPENALAGDARAAIERAGAGLVAALELFDLYAGESVGTGRKSLAYHVVLQSPDRTLRDKDLHRFLDRVESEVAALGGELRRE